MPQCATYGTTIFAPTTLLTCSVSGADALPGAEGRPTFPPPTPHPTSMHHHRSPSDQHVPPTTHHTNDHCPPCVSNPYFSGNPLRIHPDPPPLLVVLIWCQASEAGRHPPPFRKPCTPTYPPRLGPLKTPCFSDTWSSTHGLLLQVDYPLYTSPPPHEPLHTSPNSPPSVTGADLVPGTGGRPPSPPPLLLVLLRKGDPMPRSS